MKRTIVGCAGLWLVLQMAGVGAAESFEPPSAAKVLSDNGYTDDLYQVLTSWNECPKQGGEMVYGAHVASLDGSEVFDLYYDASGTLLDADRLELSGVVQKQWGWKSITKAAEFPVAVAKSGKPVQPVLKSLGFVAEQFELGVPDVDAALYEDEMAASSGEKGALRIGVAQDMGAPIQVFASSSDAGSWRESADGGWIWAVTLNAPGAVGIRVHFSVVTLPDGASLAVYNTQDPGEAYGPLGQGGAFWSPTCFNDSVTVEYYVPSLSGFSERDPLIEIDRTVYQYRSLESLQKAGAGTCNNDVTCYDDWQSAAKAVGGLGAINGGDMIWCTGTLLVDADAKTVQSYFLTANHCVYTVGAADSLEVYWLYGSTVCGDVSTIPPLASVPRTTGGADYLVGSSVNTGTDVTLLRLRGSIPQGLTYAGFSAEYKPNGTEVTCIHHPQGDYKRISFGKTTAISSPSGTELPPTANFYRVKWDIGTTEAGSSGSPLFYWDPTDGPLVIGQLYGGMASCSETGEPDNFGRFDQSYPLLGPWLEGKGGNEFEVILGVEGGGYVQISGSAEKITQKTMKVGQNLVMGLGAFPNKGYAFKGWRIDDGANLIRGAQAQITVQQDIRLTAVFREKTVLLCGSGPEGLPFASSAGDGWVCAGMLFLLLAGSYRRARRRCS